MGKRYDAGGARGWNKYVQAISKKLERKQRANKAGTRKSLLPPRAAKMQAQSVEKWPWR
jgi:hypothetical protein